MSAVYERKDKSQQDLVCQFCFRCRFSCIKGTKKLTNKLFTKQLRAKLHYYIGFITNAVLQQF